MQEQTVAMWLALTLVSFAFSQVTMQVSDDDFVWDTRFVSDDWQSHFEGHLSEHQDAFTHWCSKFSVNPNLVLSLMDMESGALSKVEADGKPFGELSVETGFSEQLQDVLSKLTQTFYEVLEKQELQLKKDGRLESEETAATQALQGLFARSRRGPVEYDQLGELSGTYQRHFKTSLLTDKASFTPKMAKQSPPTFQLPWPRGNQWTGGGAHGDDGRSRPYASLDFARGWPKWGGTVYPTMASNSGNVSIRSSCSLRVTHTSGWATNYYHMDKISVRKGQSVSRGASIAVYASGKSQALCNGGSSTGPHVHLTLLNAGRLVSVQGHVFSGYKVNVGRSSYDDDCRYFYWTDSRGNKVCAWTRMTA